MSQIDPNRANLLSSLIKKAREEAGSSAEDCAKILNLTTEDYISLEEYPEELSLPQLESLALFLKVPMSHFWGSVEPEVMKHQLDYDLYRSLRQRIIGVKLYQARIEADILAQDLADDLGISEEILNAFELGQEPIPYFDLERFASRLDVPLTDFTEEGSGPLVEHESVMLSQHRFEHLPPDVKAFVLEPVNLSYIKTAMRLSEMDVDKLRSIAEGILEITF